MMSGKTGESLYDNVIRDLLRMDTVNDMEYTTHPQRLAIKSKGIEIACADAHDEKSWGRIQGKTVAGWLADEITRHPKSFVDMAIGRCRHDGKTWPKFWTCNPEYPEHFVKTDYIDNGKIDIRTWHFTLEDNPTLSPEYVAEMKAAYSGVFYDRYILGKWVMAEGLVYDEFDASVHVLNNIQPKEGWTLVRGIDYGYTNPFVCLWGALDEDGRLYIYDEHYRPRTLMDSHASAIKARPGHFQWTVSDHDAQDSAELSAKGISSRPAQKEVILGIQKVKTRLKAAGDGRPRLFISSKCQNVIREFGMYRWANAKEGLNEKEEPVKENDHAMDVIRYMVMECDTKKVFVFA